MCGRYNLAGLTWKELWRLMSRGEPPEGWDDGRDVQAIPQRFNTAPTQQVPVVRIVRRGDDDIHPAMARWGLIPRWFRKHLKEWKANTINARIETVAEAPSYREAYQSGRCIVPMSGYYEWASLSDDPKQPYYIQPKGNTPALLICGLWSEATLPDFTGLTCAILTEPARDELAMIHDRQPVIVDAEGARAWLDGAPIEAVPRLPTARLTMHKVSKRVNDWRAEDPGLIVPDDPATDPDA
jgi:putative SOS response-associated peptidase YedK